MLVKKWFIILIFLVLGIIAILWFLFELSKFLGGLGDTFFIFNRGAFYLFGIGVVLITLMYEPIYKLIKEKELSIKSTSIVTKIILVNLFLIIVLPVLASFLVPIYANQNNYSICEGASYAHGWPIFREVYYAKTEGICQELVANQNI